MDVAKLYDLLKTDLDAVEKRIEETFLDASSVHSKDILEFILLSKGKMIRPILVFLSTYLLVSNVSKKEHEKVLNLACAVEVIHMASLLHDDVIDHAAMRRDQVSLNAKYGTDVAVTMGVYLYSVGLNFLAKAGSVDVLGLIGTTVRTMCEGEVIQYSVRQSQTYNADDYFKVIYSKTAVLFEAACLSGPSLLDVPEAKRGLLSQYALSLGEIYQLTDDYLDCFGSQTDLNKEVGQDYLQGQLTLPLIKAFDSLNKESQVLVLTRMKEKDVSGLDVLKKAMESHHVKEQISNTIRAKVELARTSLAQLPQNEFNESLLFLVDYVVDRVTL